MAAGDLLELRLVHQYGVRFRTVGLGFVTLSDSDSVAQDLSEEWVAVVGPAWANTMNSGGRVRRIEVFDGADGNNLLNRWRIPGDLFGTDVLLVAPLQCAALIRWTSGLAGRSNRGRSYLWLFSGYHIVDGDHFGDDMIARLQAVVDIMLSTYGPTGTSALARHVVLSRQVDGALRPTPVGVPVVAGEPVRLLATQRLRLTPGSGG